MNDRGPRPEPRGSAASRAAASAAPSEMVIVGIGASAGGLEALERLFASLPDRSGMAFVVVQHLSPDFKSVMDELLGRHTGMAIRQVTDGMTLEPDSVYLMPPRKEMTLAAGRLHLADKTSQRDLSLPIDHFFRSLAEDAGPRAVAIVLSGTGSDGSRGIRDVHALGGLVIVQTPESAQFDGMPRSAQDSGVADATLAPEEMPREILAHAARLRDGRCAPAAVPDGAESIFKLLRDDFGIDFSYYKPNTVGRRIERRQTISRLDDLGAYVARLHDDPAERNALYRDLLIGVTRFFRDPEAFERLERDVLPGLLHRRPPDEEVRVWVAGCATGEEAYSLAMLLDEQLRLLPRRPKVKIFASDAHPASLEVAAAGVYDQEKLASVTPSRLDRYFVRRPDGYHVASELRQMIVFTVHNVINDAPFTRLDLVSCRNLLIYFQQPVQRRVLSLFHFALRTGGVLVLGPSEGPGELAEELEDVDPHWKIYRKRRDVRLPHDLRQPLAMPLQLRAVPTVPPQLAGDTPSGAYEQLLERFLPAGVLVDERRRLVHSFGDTSRLLALPRGRASTDILDLVPPELRLPIAAALQRATREGRRATHPAVTVANDGANLRVTIAVEPLFDRHGQVTNYFVAIDGRGTIDCGATAADDGGHETPAARTSSLEAELELARENLHATVEELETSNEELQTANEELVASNEELQSTNEELHSVNQELYTVNAEYQKKIQELTELTDDMDHLLRSTDVGTIFLDHDLCIRKFTPQIGRTFDLLPHDVGRRIDGFSHTVRFPALIETLHRVLETGERFETDVQDRGGNWFFLRVLPYESRAGRAGVVLSLIDISPVKRAEARLAELSAIVESSDDAIVGSDLEGHVRTWNGGAARLFGYHLEEVVGRPLSLLHLPDDPDHRPDFTPEVLARMRAGLPADYHLETIRVRKDGLRVEVQLSCSAIRDPSGAFTGISITARDVTRRRAAERALAERMRLASLRASVALALAHDEDLHASLQRSAEAVVANAEAAVASIWVLAPDGESLRLLASASRDPNGAVAPARSPVGEPLAARIAHDGQAYVTDDVASDPLLGDPAWVRRERMVAFAGYPLAIAGRSLGVLAVFGRAALGEQLRSELGAVAHDVAQSIERRRAAEAIRRYADELERANHELRENVARREEAEAEARAAVDRRDRFLAILSHELRNPLAAILNASRLLERGGGEERLRVQAQGAIGRQSRQMARLLDDLLDVSRISRNKIEIKKELVDLGGIAREASELVRAQASARGHRLDVDLAPTAVRADGDPARLQQIVVNLLTNAVKYTPEHGHIVLSVRRDGTHAVLRVQDDGPGIPSEMRQKVFDLFFQLDGSVGHSDGSMGVGLTLVRSLVGLHGGTVAIEEPPGGGCAFVVRLPLAQDAPAAEEPAGDVGILDGLRVLVVEDNEDIRTTMVGLLQDLGWRVDAAEDGATGIAAFEHTPPDVALIDIGMPGMNGYEVARRIRQLGGGNDTLLIALTGFGQEEDRARARAAGFDAHLVKPVDFARLAATIDHLRTQRPTHAPSPA